MTAPSGIDRALAELRAIPMREAPPRPEPTACPFDCTGDRRGYQWHQRTGNLPACQASLEANRAYMREAHRAFRSRRPDYYRKWRAKRTTT